MSKRFNPYIIGAPVRDTAFYGREKLINVVQVTLAVKTVNLIVLFGQRRIGKTSLLQNLGIRPELEDYFFFYNDAVDLADKPAYEVLYHFGQKITQAVGLEAPTKSQLQKDEGLFQRDFLPRAYEAIGSRRLVILLDEFDIFERRRKLTSSGSNINGANSALNVIENLISYEPDLAFIVTLSRGKEKLHSDLNRITRTGHWAKISLLEKEDALGLIVEPAREQLTYLPEAVDAVFALTAGHPYYTQLLCYEIFNELQAEGRHQVEISDVRKAAKEALETGRGGFGWLWEGLAPAQKIVASLLAEAAEDSRNHFISEAQLSTAFENNHIHRRGLELVEAPNQLIDLDIIERKGPGIYHYLVELVRCWVHEKHPISREREENLALLSDRAASEFSKGQSAGSRIEPSIIFERRLW
jgi:AAA+ ATPase superfamily predicted ATPase